jgi:hypothetical protein
MRITPEILRKIARDTVAQRTKSNRNILAVYLIGSLLKEDPLIGGTTDIDLVFIHNGEAPFAREIIRLTDEVHIDIAHHSRFLYHQPRELRVHPWMGPTIYGCKILYDPQHFMDFTMASASAQFLQPENVLARANQQVEQARQTWLSYQLETPEAGPEEIDSYLKAVENAANAAASLTGAPLPERRALLEYPQRAEAAGRPGLQKGLLGLLGANHADPELVQSWLPQWRKALESTPAENRPPRLHIHRIPYYQRSFDYFLSTSEPMNLLWPLLHTWTEAANLLPPESDPYKEWAAAMDRLELRGAHFEERLSGLDAFLDTVEDLIENWGRQHGAVPEEGLR